MFLFCLIVLPYRLSISSFWCWHTAAEATVAECVARSPGWGKPIRC